ncbi:hypothetical protein BCR35DRAFT_303290 [Leucosporidium creatinivorum]|uniref:Uncharacterized protein n=1 Tax=Leucosporidium creatinivorum TaxID=106004 RepID=A0A1Y2FLG7_9BASI|nr:hypothetical protein BCR35DRAFT_303290 [Leucosporidium creatinivorum]
MLRPPVSRRASWCLRRPGPLSQSCRRSSCPSPRRGGEQLLGSLSFAAVCRAVDGDKRVSALPSTTALLQHPLRGMGSSLHAPPRARCARAQLRWASSRGLSCSNDRRDCTRYFSRSVGLPKEGSSKERQLPITRGLGDRKAPLLACSRGVADVGCYRR